MSAMTSRDREGAVRRLAILTALSVLLAFAPIDATAQASAIRSKSRPPSGPVFVPLDSWVYPALERLGALGYITRQALGMRPWTRVECERQIREAEEVLAETIQPDSAEAARLVAALRREFVPEGATRQSVNLESVYVRWLGISGRPLTDGYNFGQTVINDYGRPVGEGSNEIVGFSANAVYGRFSFYSRSEFQHTAPFASPAGDLKPVAPQLVPVQGGAPDGAYRFRPLEAYAGIQLGSWSLTAGKQDLWWGPGETGPLSFSNNAEPFESFRLTSGTPLVLPGILGRLGAFRLDIIGGRLSGQRIPPRPLLNGQKLTWNIGRGLELGFTRWSLFGGTGVRGLTVGAVLRNLFANGATFGTATDPGDRKSGFDFRWKVPWYPVTIYSDFYADDEPSPLTSPRRSAFSPGIYIARLPGLAKWDLRVEAPSTRLATTDRGGFFLYWNSVYQNANTNGGNLLGTWAGRDGRGLLAQVTYWHSARTRVEFGYRQNRIGPAFLPGGGTQTNGLVRGSFQMGPDWCLGVSAQYERYAIPVLGGPRRNVLGSLELVYTPHRY